MFQPGTNLQPLLLKTITVDNQGNPLKFSGSYTQQIVFDDEGALAYIAGSNDKIYVFDTETQDIIATYTVQGSSAPISSLAFNDGWLYVAEGSNYGSGGELVRVNVDESSPDFLNVQQTLDIPGALAPYGFEGMAVNDGRYLAITAPAGRIPVTNGPVPAPGNVYVIDLDGVGTSDNIDASNVTTLNLADYPSAYLGKGPLYITSGDETGQFLVSNSKDFDSGLAAISFGFDPGDGTLTGTSILEDPQLTPAATNPAWLQAPEQQNIQSAAGTVIVTYQGQTYALVADQNYLFNDPHYTEDDNYGLGEQIGGKIGVIEDPFGTPIYLGATTPIPGVALNQLTLDQNGMLYAVGFVDDTSGLYSSAETMYDSMFVWNAGQLIQAALNAQKAGQPTSTPIDRTSPTSAQNPAVTPARYDGTGLTAAQLFGSIYGIGTYSAPQGAPAISLQDVPYLQQLDPSIFAAAKAAATQAGVPTPPPKDTSNTTLNTLMIRVGAEMTVLINGLAAVKESLFDEDNSAALAELNAASQVLGKVDYNTSDTSTQGLLGLGFAKGLDGLVIGASQLTLTIAGYSARIAAGAQNLLYGATPNLPQLTELDQEVDSGASGLQQLGTAASIFIQGNPYLVGASAIYREYSALLAGDYKGTILAGSEAVALVGVPHVAGKLLESTASQVELKIKQMAFDEEKLEEGEINESPLEFIQRGPSGQEYFEQPETAGSSGLPGQGVSAPGQVLELAPAAQVAAQLEGSLTVGPTGEVEYRTPEQPDGCFVAGTLVHTKEGPVPIEKLRVGDWVLSQPELKGELAYRQVVETFAFEDKEVCLLEYFVTHEVTARNLVVTGNHPFWVKDVGWTRADKLSPGANLELHDGRAAYVYRVRKVFKTGTPDVGWTYNDDTFLGPTIDLRDGRVQVSKFSEEDTCDKAALEVRESLTRQVFNVEVDGFHTYYVGEVGVWAHNTNCKAPLGTVSSEGVTLNSQEEIDAGLSLDPDAPVFDPTRASNYAESLENEQGVVLVEKGTSGPDASLALEEEAPGAMTATTPASGSPVAVQWGLLFENSNPNGLDVITFESRITVMTETGPEYTNTFNDVKANLIPFFKVDAAGNLEPFTNALRQNWVNTTLRNIADATAANPGTTVMFSMDNSEPTPGELNNPTPLQEMFMLFDTDVMSHPDTAGYATNVMFSDPANPDVAYSYNPENLIDPTEVQRPPLPDGSPAPTLWTGEPRYSVEPLAGDTTGTRPGAPQLQDVLTEGSNSAVVPLTQSDADSLLAAATQYWLSAGASPALLNNLTVGVGSLPVGVAAETAGSQITLSVNGAGWGWFVDPNPNVRGRFHRDQPAQRLYRQRRRPGGRQARSADRAHPRNGPRARPERCVGQYRQHGAIPDARGAPPAQRGRHRTDARGSGGAAGQHRQRHIRHRANHRESAADGRAAELVCRRSSSEHSFGRQFCRRPHRLDQYRRRHDRQQRQRDPHQQHCRGCSTGPNLQHRQQ